MYVMCHVLLMQDSCKMYVFPSESTGQCLTDLCFKVTRTLPKQNKTPHDTRQIDFVQADNISVLKDLDFSLYRKIPVSALPFVYRVQRTASVITVGCQNAHSYVPHSVVQAS